MEALSARLPSPSGVDQPVAQVVGQLTALAGKVTGFAPAKLDVAVSAGGSVAVPDSFALVGPTVATLQTMLTKLPSDPEQLTGALTAGLGTLLGELGGLGEVLKPISQVVNVLAPFVSKATAAAEAVGRMSTLLSGVKTQATGLDLTRLPDLLDLLLRVLSLVPEAQQVPVLSDLKAQLEVFKTWVGSSPAALTTYFRDTIQTLADSLPTQLDNVANARLQLADQIDAQLPKLDRSAWLDPYVLAVTAVEALDPADPGQLVSAAQVVAQQRPLVEAAAQAAGTAAQGLNDVLGQLRLDAFVTELGAAWLRILDILAPARPGPLALVFSQLERAVGLIELEDAQPFLREVEALLDDKLGPMELTTLTDQLDTVKQTIDGVVGEVQQALVGVATQLSSLVNELKGLIAQLDLPALKAQVESAFNELKTSVEAALAPIAELTTELGQLVDELVNDVAALDFGIVATALQDLLHQLTGVLGDPQVVHFLEEARAAIDAVAANLEAVSLKPVFDRVVEEIGSLRTALAEVDVGELNDLLKVALAGALAILKQIDFATQVADTLNEQFQAVLDQSGGLLEPLSDAYDALVGQLDAFSPGALVANLLGPPFEALVKEVEKLDPSVLIAPLQAVFDELKRQLSSVSPSQLLQPLSDLHGRLVAALAAVSPTQLLAPLNALLGQVTGLLSQLGLETLLDKVSGGIGQVTGLLGGLPIGPQLLNTPFFGLIDRLTSEVGQQLDTIEHAIDGFQDGLLAPVSQVDMAQLGPVLAALQQAVATVIGHLESPTLAARLGSSQTTLEGHHVAAGVTDLTQRWLAQKTRLAAASPPPGGQTALSELRANWEALSPIVLMAPASTRVAAATPRLSAARAELEAAKQALAVRLERDRPKLEALLVAESTADAFKATLRKALEDQLGGPAKALIQRVRSRLAMLGSFLDPLKALIKRFEGPFSALSLVPQLLGQLTAAVQAIQQVITGLNLSFLEDELQGVLDEVMTQLQALDPGALVGQLDALYQSLVATLESLWPAALLEDLSTRVKAEVVAKLKALHPDETVAKPLDGAWSEVLALAEALDIKAIFEAVEGKLETLGDELEDGLKRAAKAFNELLSSLPNVSASVSVGF